MKPTDFSVQVTHFLTHYLAGQRNLSPNTIGCGSFETTPSDQQS